MIRHLLLLIAICFPFALATGERPGAHEAFLRDEADAELNRVYKEVIATLPPQRRVVLRDEERAWIKSRDEEASRRAHASAVGGSAYRVEYLNALTDLIRKRTAELQSRMTERIGQTAFDATMPSSSVESPSDSAAPVGQPTPAGKDASSGDPLITAGAERFVVGGLTVGAVPSQVVSFLASKGLRPSGERQLSYMQGARTVQRVNYVAKESYSNRKTGLEEVKAELSFTPPARTAGGVFPLVYAISYETHYGEGLTVDEIKADLKSRYGLPETDSNGLPPFLRWYAAGKGEDTFGAIAEAHIIPAPNPGGLGTLRLWVQDNSFRGHAIDSARAHLDEIDAQRSKDKTKPSY